MPRIGEIEEQLHAFLTSALDGCEWSASRPGRFSPKEWAPGTHWRGEWVSPRVGLDAVKIKKNPINAPDKIQRPAANGLESVRCMH
jgi:hypothetical protein